VDVCVVHRSPKIEALERVLVLALVAVVGGTRLPVTLVDVRLWIVDHFGILGDSFHVKRYYPEDFIIMFSYLDDMLKECCTTSPRVMLHSASSSKGDGGSCTPVQKICAITLRCTSCRHTYATSPLPHRFLARAVPIWSLLPR
jgi:hypothetical protein